MKVLEAIKVKWSRIQRKNKARIGTAIYMLAFPLLLLLSPNQLGGKIAPSIIWLSGLIIMLVEMIYIDNKSHPIYRIKEQVEAAIGKYLTPLILAGVYLVFAVMILLILHYGGEETTCEVLNPVAFACTLSILILKAYSYARRGKEYKEDAGMKCMWAIILHFYVLLLSLYFYMEQEWFSLFVSIYFPVITIVLSGWVWTYEVYRKSSDSSKEQPQT